MKKIILGAGMLFCYSIMSAQNNADGQNEVINSEYIITEDNTTEQVPVFDQKTYQHKSIAALNGIPYHTDEDIKTRLAMIPSEIPLVFTPEIGQMIRTYLYTKREYLGRILTSSQVFFPIFEEVFLLKRMPLELKYLAVVESALKPHARSRCGATGLWQFMAGTAKQEGMCMNNYIDERRDVFLSTDYAADFLKKLYNNHGDWYLALAAYNSGSGNVSKAIRNSGGYDFWSIKHKLPRETQGYVPAFITVFYCMYYSQDYKLYADVPAYSFANTAKEKIYDKVSLKYLSELIGSCEEEIQQYNPALKKGIIPQHPNGYELIIPKQYMMALNSNRHLFGEDPYLYAPIEPAIDNTEVIISGISPNIQTIQSTKSEPISLTDTYTNVVLPKTEKSIASSEAASAQVSAESQYKIIKVVETNTKKQIHIVRKGQNLTQIAREYQVTLADIRKWNELEAGDQLYSGKKLEIYRSERIVKPQYVINNTRSNPATYASKPVSQLDHSATNTTEKSNFITHRIKKGETLMMLTRQYDCSLSQLKDWNNITTLNTTVGQEIRIFNQKTSTELNPTNTLSMKNYSYYDAQRGDTLQTASARYGIPLEVLKSLNNKDENEPFNEGEKIKIPAI
jgi:membrane-bound lytic murein transglycosylase D